MEADAAASYHITHTQPSDIDPRLQESAQASQPYHTLPPSSFAQSPSLVRLNVPSQPAQHPQYAPPPQWSQDSYNPYYAHPSDQQHPPVTYQINHAPSAASVPPNDGRPTSVESKRPRACEACRGLKVKCESDPGSGPCKRCAKAGRTCVITPPSRKRQKKSDSRVADLERKIDALTASLHATKDGDVSGSDDDDNNYAQRDTSHAVSVEGRPSQLSPYVPSPGTGQKRSVADYQAGGYHQTDYSSAPNAPSMSLGPFTHAFSAHGTQTMDYMRHTSHNAPGDADVVARGFLHAETAEKLFIHYVNHLAPQMPIVVFPGETSSEIMRSTKPILLLAILSVSSSQENPDLQARLRKEITRILADCIIINGDKTIELIQALQIITTWYWPEASEASKLYQFVHMAATMAIDLGLDRKPGPSKKQSFDTSSQNSLSPDIENIESRRAWLGCYLLGSSLAMALKRKNLVQVNTYTGDCVKVLGQSKDGLPSDKILCHWVQLQKLTDEMVAQVPLDDAGSTSAAKIRNAYKDFEREMKAWEGRVLSNVTSLPLSLAFHMANLYMHELVVPHSAPEPPKPSRSRGKSQPQALPSTSAGQSNSELTSTLGALDVFTNMSVDDLRTLPTFQLSQVAHASISMINIYFASISDPERSQEQPVNASIVEQRLNGIAESMRAAAANEESFPGRCSTFLMIIISLRAWYEKRSQVMPQSATEEANDAVGAGKAQSVSQGSSPQQQKTRRSGENSARALHMLSEVAMGKSSNGYSQLGTLNAQQMAQAASGLTVSAQPSSDGLPDVLQMLDNMDWGRISSTLLFPS